MRLDTALLGHWSSHPFELGIMELSELEFRGDGTGSTTLANASGDDVTDITWHCPATGVLELRDEYGDVSRVRYTLSPAVPATGGEPVPAVTFEPPLLHAHQYARTGYPN
ncbi:hypothetical protein [Streptomyces sp. NPDC048521]|uniref:hypothetical protein n=1 Tax=Streptomyces sp. NPDC048521 TaxID=3365566 RepID=UPI003718D719